MRFEPGAVRPFHIRGRDTAMPRVDIVDIVEGGDADDGEARAVEPGDGRLEGGERCRFCLGQVTAVGDGEDGPHLTVSGLGDVVCRGVPFGGYERSRRRYVGGGRGEESDVVEGRAERHDAFAARPLVARLPSRYAAVRRGARYRAYGLGAEGERAEAGGDGGGRSRARSSRRPREVPRVGRRARREVREFGRHGLAEHEGASVTYGGYDGPLPHGE